MNRSGEVTGGPSRRGRRRDHPRHGDPTTQPNGSGAADASRAAGPKPPDRATVKEIVRAGTMAPSMHNTQPWRFSYDPATGVIDLYADPERKLPHGDPHGRAMHLACGAALLNVRLAAAVQGRHPIVRLLPDPRKPLLLASVRLAGQHRAQPDELELFAAIPVRRTNREPFSARRVPAGILAELIETAELEGATLHLLDDEETHRILGLSREAERELLADPGYRAELAAWAGGHREADGIPDSSLGPRSADGPAPVREFAPGVGPARLAWFEESPQLAVLATRFGERTDWLRAGQAMQRVLLTATSRGISASPLTQALEVSQAWLVRDPWSAPEHPQLILRLGYGLPVPASPRRPVGDVLG